MEFQTPSLLSETALNERKRRMEIKKVSIIGCGALGIMYAGHMLQNFPRDQIQFIADQDRINKYKNTEFYSNGVRQSFNFVSSDVCAQPSDLVIFAVKYHHLRDAMRIARNHIGENTIILSFLNGISSEGIIGEEYNPAKIINCMVAGMDATRTGNSVNFTQVGYIAFGALKGNDPDDISSLAAFFDRVRIRYEIKEDIIKAIWWKYMLNSGINQTSAVLKAPYGLFQTSQNAEEIMVTTMREVCEVSKKMGIGLDEDDIDSAVNIIKTLSPDGKTSMCQDIEAGRPSEIDMFSGVLIELGKKHNVPVPVNTFLFNAVKALESRY